MPDIMRETLEHKEMMKAAKREKYREQRLKTLPTLDETVEGKRGKCVLICLFDLNIRHLLKFYGSDSLRYELNFCRNFISN